jgi:trk system potassium uptake protein TrkA
MKIIIAGGGDHADFLIGLLKREGETIVAINADRALCKRFASTHTIRTVLGDATKRYVLDSAGIDGFDVVIALMANDADNFVVCQQARRFYGVKKDVCSVNNPENVSVFKRLGISSVINSTMIISEAIKEASSIEGLTKNLRDVEDELYPHGSALGPGMSGVFKPTDETSPL